jgi:tripartite-type tricarboxylate transporter receptor subunit TctC
MIARRLLLGALAAAPAAGAQAQPAGPVRVIVPWPAGGNADSLARVVAGKLAELLGQPFVADNHSGAAGNLGMEAAAATAPDGQTLVEVISANAINVTLYPRLGFSLTRDFAPIGMAALMPLVLVVHPSLPVHSVPELIAYLRAHPGRVNYASGGSGTGGHLAAELFRSMAGGLDIVHVPYRGATPAITDLVAGQTQLFFDGVPSCLPHIQSGRLRALAVTTARRSDALPDVPSLAEAGLTDFDMGLWLGFMVRAGTGPETIRRLNGALNHALADDGVRQRLRALGLEPRPGTPEQFGAYLEAEVARWATVIRGANVRVE